MDREQIKKELSDISVFKALNEAFRSGGRTFEEVTEVFNTKPETPDPKPGSLFIYLASPFTDEMEYVMAHRYGAVKYHLVKLQTAHPDKWIYSPIVHYYGIANFYNLPKDHLFWKNINHKAIDKCDELWVLMLPGWDISKGVADEMQYAWEQGKRVRFIPINNEANKNLLTNNTKQ